MGPLPLPEKSRSSIEMSGGRILEKYVADQSTLRTRMHMTSYLKGSLNLGIKLGMLDFIQNINVQLCKIQMRIHSCERLTP